ncbi:GT2 family glycosyltransferase [Parabacteroides sp. PF5-5]|uniref:glycosyltransferase n=1 Tax=unclassified Parabacteroides TaxID=2649774 RepID=UPI002473A2BD|nr:MULTISPECIES: glycosyltransferase [unclassified Parabacteroides]MDH6316370.1 GT2 family glycosyltransferase [Parabacteroides sp. PF5-13]MDH6327557.1 GT2 family glycosyltransferase [Parabacteroides sp. PH5-41]MDH6335303.1 GT2 family glycosyltransferase [Parabacteroides sp. PF5-5]MDH6346366.1 GT2 family glycosyltransferase [Parabacteroides sp. PH5-46]MDH6361383.1 GT2 family glycosyltransferase [Parabacteroides sp. PH5-16]
MVTASLVLYYTSKEDLEKILTSVNESMIEKLYVIDHSLDEKIAKFIKEKSNKAIYYHEINRGYGAGHNVALRLAKENDNPCYHVVLNPDVYFAPETILQLKMFMDENYDVGLVSPKVFYPDGSLQMLCKLLPYPSDIFYRQFLPSRIKKKIESKFVLTKSGYNKIMNVPYLSGCFMFFRMSSICKVGLFDERFFLHFEDVDISRRIHEKYKTIFYPDAFIIHAHAAEHKKKLKMLMVGFKSAVKYFNKWGWLFDTKRRKINQKVLKSL